MTQLSRRAAIRILAAGGGLLGLGAAGGYVLRSLRGPDRTAATATAPANPGAMMGDATAADMTTYLDLFRRHAELRRTVELVPGGVRTVTEADDPGLAAQLRAHVASMYAHLNKRAEVTCMSSSLPVLFRNSERYRRSLTSTASGVAVVETSDDPRITAAIRAHAAEVTVFVDDGTPAKMAGMTGRQNLTGGASP